LDHVHNILEGVYDPYYLYKMFLLKRAMGDRHGAFDGGGLKTSFKS